MINLKIAAFFAVALAFFLVGHEWELNAASKPELLEKPQKAGALSKPPSKNGLPKNHDDDFSLLPEEVDTTPDAEFNPTASGKNNRNMLRAPVLTPTTSETKQAESKAPNNRDVKSNKLSRKSESGSKEALQHDTNQASSSKESRIPKRSSQIKSKPAIMQVEDHGDDSFKNQLVNKQTGKSFDYIVASGESQEIKSPVAGRFDSNRQTPHPIRLIKLIRIPFIWLLKMMIVNGESMKMSD